MYIFFLDPRVRFRQSVRLSVCLSMDASIEYRDVHGQLLKIGSSVDKWWKLTDPDYSEEIPFPLFWPKRGQNGPKIGFSEFWRKSSPLMWIFSHSKWSSIIFLTFLRKPHVREKSRSRVRGLNLAQFFDSQSKTVQYFFLIFSLKREA